MQRGLYPLLDRAAKGFGGFAHCLPPEHVMLAVAEQVGLHAAALGERRFQPLYIVMQVVPAQLLKGVLAGLQVELRRDTIEAPGYFNSRSRRHTIVFSFRAYLTSARSASAIISSFVIGSIRSVQEFAPLGSRRGKIFLVMFFKHVVPAL